LWFNSSRIDNCCGQKYVEGKLSIAKNAALTMPSNGAVHSQLRTFGINSRRYRESFMPKHHPSYGYQISCRDVLITAANIRLSILHRSPETSVLVDQITIGI